MDLDELFSKIGEFGRYQKTILCTISFPLMIASSFVTFNQLFMAETPNHWCRVPELENRVENVSVRQFLSIPLMQNGERFEKCLRYKFNWSEVDDETLKSFMPNSSWPVEPCLQGWHYDLSEISSSVVIDFNLVCEDRIYPTLGLVILNLSGPFGAFFFGLMNDRMGRKLSIIACLATAIVSNFSSSVSTNVAFWLVTRLMLGLTVPALYHIAFILTLEIVGPNYRSFYTFTTGILFAFANMLLAGVSYAIPNWKHMSMVTSLPFILTFVMLWFIPESPRWLLARKRRNEAIEVLKKIADINGKSFPKSFMDSTETSLLSNGEETRKAEIVKKPTVMDLCRTPNMRLKTVLISFIWFVVEIVYIGLSYYGPALGDESHMSFFLSSLVEIPASIVCWCAMDRFGRKLPLSALLMLSGVSCVITVLLPQDANLLILILYLTSKFGIAASYLLMFTYAGELFPTNIRGMGLAMAAYICGIGRIFLPFLTDLGSDLLVLPLVILGILSVLGGIFTLKLPETLHQPLPQTVEEGEEFGKNVPWMECLKSAD